MKLTFRYRVKDGSSGTRNALLKQARAVNYVWNFLCDTQRHAMKWGRRWPTYFDLTKLTSGVSAELGIHSDTVNAVCRQFIISRNAARRCPRFRGRKSLSWIPISNAPRGVKIDGSTICFLKRKYRLWLSRPLDGKLRVASFGCDARGRWYFNAVCDVDDTPTEKVGSIGIDLGLKSFAALSDGRAIDAPRFFRRYESALGMAQRSGNKRRAAAIHAKIANARKDFLHKFSTDLVRNYGTIVVGNVSAGQLKRTNMAKSVSDASWYAFKTMLAYKAARHRVRFIEANESYSTQTCSDCGSISGPKGRKGLVIRRWECVDCGAVHDRDHNAAINILRAGAAHRPLSGEIAA